jgi:predicted dehydrogenase
MIQIGTGGFGALWCQRFLPPNVHDGLIEVVAAADVNAPALGNAQQHLGLDESQLYSDPARAIAENDADFCSIVVPPASHEEIVDLAVERGLHILSEKPIADTLEGSVRIADKVQRAGLKMGVTMSHRFDQDKTTLRSEVQSGRYGALDYVVLRFGCDCRKYGSWGAFRHEIPDTLMIEGAVHHLDIIADLAGGLCTRLYAETWNPEWGEFEGDSQGLVIMAFDNGARGTYEGSKTNAVGLNCWTNEYVRVEMEGATLILDRREVERFEYDPGSSGRAVREGTGVSVPPLQQSKWANTWLVEKFVRWLEGGEPMETDVESNLQSVALVFAAIESSRTGMPVNPQELLERTRAATT